MIFRNSRSVSKMFSPLFSFVAIKSVSSVSSTRSFTLIQIVATTIYDMTNKESTYPIQENSGRRIWYLYTLINDRAYSVFLRIPPYFALWCGPVLRSYFSEMYGNISLAYPAQGRYREALSSEEQALAFRQKFLPSTHRDLALSYESIGLIHHCIGHYDLARKISNIRSESKRSHFLLVTQNLQLVSNVWALCTSKRKNCNKLWTIYRRH